MIHDPGHPDGSRRFASVLARPVGVRLADLDLFLVVPVPVAVVLFEVFRFSLLLLAVVVELSLWLIQKYHLDYLDDPAEHRARG